MKIVVRHMTPSDLDQVMEIALSEKSAPRWTREMYAAASDPHSVPKRVALVAEAPEPGGALAGFGVASVIAPEAELETIVTAQAFQRRGVASQLFAHLARELRQLGALDVLLEVRESNRAGRALHESLGFVESGRRKAYYADPIEDAIHMHLRLR